MKGLHVFFGVLLAVLCTAALPAHADEYSFKRTVDTAIPAGGAKTLDVTGYNGNIHIYGDAGTTVRVHAVLGARSADALQMLSVRTGREGSTVRVQDVCPETRHFFFWSFADCDIELEVHYPRALGLTLNSKNGNITIDGAAAAVSVTNANGNIHVNRSTAGLTVKNANGNVTIAGASANVSASSNNGNVTATLDDAWRGTAIAMSTHAGNVELQVPRNFEATLTAHTRMGDVKDRANLRSGPVTVTATTTLGNVVITRE